VNIWGILSVSKAKQLNYPYVAVIKNLSSLCDRVLVGIDPTYPEDTEGWGFENVSIFWSKWNRDNRDCGTEIALQMDKLVAEAALRNADWVVVMQADEMLNDEDFEMLRAFMDRAPQNTIGFKLNRLYFWKNLGTVRKDWNAELVRIFRPGTCSFMADGTDRAGMYSGQIADGNIINLPFNIYHYSRIGEPLQISKRVRMLDSLFHADETLILEEHLPEYDFTPRTHDNFSINGLPDEVVGEFYEYKGIHPLAAQEYFNGSCK